MTVKTYIITLVVMMLLTVFAMVYDYLAARPLDHCAKSNNVYECHWVAVPKGIKPIDEGELGDME